VASKKIIYVVQVTRQLSIDILNCFAENGYETVLLTGVIESQYQPLNDSVKIKKFKTYNQKSIAGRVISGLIFHIQSFFYILFNGSRSKLILVSTPPFILHLGYFFYQIRKQKYYLLVWDLYPDVLIHSSIIKRHSVIDRVWSWHNRKCFRQAEHIFTLGNLMQSAVLRYTKNEVTVIPPWSNTSFINPVQDSKNPFTQEHKLEMKFIVMYSGNLGLTHKIETMVETAALLRDRSNIVFIIIGEGGKKERIKQLAEKHKLGNILLLPYQNKEMMPYSIGSAHLAWITLAEGAEHVSVPSKTFNALSAGSVLIAVSNENSALAEIVNEYQCGQLFSNQDIGKISDFILKLESDRKLWSLYSERSRQASFYFSPENRLNYYNRINQSE